MSTVEEAQDAIRMFDGSVSINQNVVLVSILLTQKNLGTAIDAPKMSILHFTKCGMTFLECQ